MSIKSTEFDQIFNLLETIKNLDQSSYSYKLKKLYEYMEGLFELSPLKVGTRVALVTPPKIGPNSGWRGSSHFLVKDSLGTVHSIDYTKEGGFTCDIVFDVESWINDSHFGCTKQTPKEMPCQKHTFHFKQDNFRVVSTEEETTLKRAEPDSWKILRIYYNLQRFIVGVFDKEVYKVNYNKIISEIIPLEMDKEAFSDYLEDTYNFQLQKLGLSLDALNLYRLSELIFKNK